jgi:hypothetical protein
MRILKPIFIYIFLTAVSFLFSGTIKNQNSFTTRLKNVRYKDSKRSSKKNKIAGGLNMDETAKDLMVGLGVEFGKLGLEKLKARISEQKKVTTEPRFSGGDIAIVVSITKPIKSTVEKFLYKEKIIADIVEIEGEKRLSSNEEDWIKIITEFYRIFLKIQSTLGAPRYHLFVSAPVALAFALGSVLGLNYDVHVYHWFEEMNDYKEVLITSRKLLGC